MSHYPDSAPSSQLSVQVCHSKSAITKRISLRGNKFIIKSILGVLVVHFTEVSLSVTASDKISGILNCRAPPFLETRDFLRWTSGPFSTFR